MVKYLPKYLWKGVGVAPDQLKIHILAEQKHLEFLALCFLLKYLGNFPVTFPIHFPIKVICTINTSMAPLRTAHLNMSTDSQRPDLLKWFPCQLQSNFPMVHPEAVFYRVPFLLVMSMA